MSGRHWSHDWHGFDDDEDRSEFMCHYCEICTCHSPEKSAGACDRLAEVERAAAEKALNRAADDLRVNFSRGAAIAMHHECHKKQCRCGNPGNDEIVREVFEAAREAIRNEALAYRRNEGENE